MRKGFSYIALLAVILIIGALAFFMLHGADKKTPDTMTDYSAGQKKTVYGQSMDAAKAVECQNNLGQARNALNMLAQSGEAYPASLVELNLPDSCTKCAVSGQPYTYNSQTGQIACPSHPNF